MADLGSLLGAAGIGGMIGKAVVQLELDTAKYATELKGAQAQTVSSTTAMGTSTSKFGSLASTAFLAAGAAAVAGLSMSVKAAIEAQEAQQKLHNTIQNAPQLNADAEKAFLDQAEAIRELTGVDDEAVIAGEALLGSMGLEKDAILDLTPLVVDLAEKHDIDLNTAFKAVGKAAQGNTGTLARYIGTIETGKNPTETLANVTEKLGMAQGFAAEQAKNQPWKLLQSDLEEISEEIGLALLPALQNMADLLRDLMPLIEGLAKGIQYLPLFQMAENITSTDNALSKLVNGLIDSIPVLGSFVDLDLGEPVDKLGEAVAESAKDLPGFTEKLKALGVGRSSVMADFAEKVDDVKHEFDDLHFSLEDVADSTNVSREEFVKYFNHLERESRELKETARELKDEEWLNRDFVDFLSAKGPEWLIRFGDENERQQKRWQDSWEDSNRRTKDANDNLDTLRSTLDIIDKSTSKHTVEIRYKYVDFDPSMPGMQTAGQQR